MARPWQSHEEFLVDQALSTATADPEAIRALRPQYPNQLFPNARGLMKNEAQLLDILDVNRYMATNRGLLSGFPVRNTMVDDTWSGAGRYSMEALG